MRCVATFAKCSCTGRKIKHKSPLLFQVHHCGAFGLYPTEGFPVVCALAAPQPLQFGAWSQGRAGQEAWRPLKINHLRFCFLKKLGPVAASGRHGHSIWQLASQVHPCNSVHSNSTAAARAVSAPAFQCHPTLRCSCAPRRHSCRSEGVILKCATATPGGLRSCKARVLPVSVGVVCG